MRKLQLCYEIPLKVPVRVCRETKMCTVITHRPRSAARSVKYYIYINIFKFVDVCNTIYMYICVPVWNKKLNYVRRCMKSFYIDHRSWLESDWYDALSIFKTISVGLKDIDVPFEQSIQINLLISTYVSGIRVLSTYGRRRDLPGEEFDEE